MLTAEALNIRLYEGWWGDVPSTRDPNVHVAAGNAIRRKRKYDSYRSSQSSRFSSWQEHEI